MKKHLRKFWFLLGVAMLLIGVTAQGQLIWSNGPAMSTARSQHTATRLKDGRILLVGGMLDGVALANVEIYDPESNSYQLTGSLNEPRFDHSATLLPDGRVLVVAGNDNREYTRGGYYLSSAEIYDPSNGSWSVTQPLYFHGVGHCAILFKDGRVLVVAGDIRPGDDGADDGVEIFDPLNNTWSAAAYHTGIGESPTATLLNDGRVLFTRNYNTETDIAETDIYDPTSNTWQSAGAISTGHIYGATTVLLQDGRVMVIGGKDYVHVLSQVDIYDPDTGIWSQAAPLHQGRLAHTATVLPDGRVVVVGGFKRWEDDWQNPDNYLNSVEIYNPCTGQWEEGPALQASRGFHTSTLLRDGRLFVAGGHSPYLYSTEVLRMIAAPLIHYVCPTGAAVPPYTNWMTAAKNIQAAIDVSMDGDTILVTNGVYDSGGVVVSGRPTNRIAITKAIIVRSVNGPAVTVIRGSEAVGGWNGNGDGAVRCVYMTNGAVLAGFILTNGYTRMYGDLDRERSGRGVWCEGSIRGVEQLCADWEQCFFWWRWGIRRHVA